MVDFPGRANGSGWGDIVKLMTGEETAAAADNDEAEAELKCDTKCASRVTATFAVLGVQFE
jgi:hypothetical protein